MNPDLSYASQNANASPEPAPQSFFTRLIGVYFSPGETFQEIGRAPRVLAPIIALALLTVVLSYVASTRLPMDKLLTQRIDEAVQSGQINEEQAERQREGMRKIAPYMKIFFPIIGLISSIVVPLIIAGIAKLASLIMGIENNFLSLFAVALYATLAISIISSLLFLILLFVKPADEFDITNPLGSNLSALLSLLGVTGLSKFLKTLLSFVDVFFIWRIILLGIGFAAVSRRLKTSTAITVTGVIGLVIALCSAGWTAMFG